MKVTREELEFRVLRTLDNFYNYIFSPGEKMREETAYHLLLKSLEVFKKEGGDVYDFRDSFLLETVKQRALKEEQEDYIYDIVDIISDNCPGHLSLDFES